MGILSSDLGYLAILSVMAGLVLLALVVRRGVLDARKWLGFLVVFLTIFTLVFGWLGNQQVKAIQDGDDGSSKVSYGPIDSLYESFQLLSLNASPQVSGNWCLTVAELFAVALATVLAGEIIRYWFSESLMRGWMAYFLRGHTVVFGLGQIGNSLAHDLLQTEDSGYFSRLHLLWRKAWSGWVVVVEPDPGCPRLHRARDAGAVVIQGDATDRDLLSRLGLRRASRVFFATGSDEHNLEAAMLAEEIIAKKPMRLLGSASEELPGSRPDLHVHLTHPELRCILDRLPKAQGFNLERRIALDLLAKLLKHRPKKVGSVVHLVIWGFGPTAQEVVRHLAECGHFESLRRLRMTIVHTPEEAVFVKAFRQRHPNLFPEPSLHSKQVPRDPFQPPPELDRWNEGLGPDGQVKFAVNGCYYEQDAGLESDQVHQSLATLAAQDGVQPIVVLCSEIEERNCSLGLAIRHEIDLRCNEKNNEGILQPRKGFDPVPIFALAPNRPVLAKEVADNRDRDPRTGVQPFGQSKLLCTNKALTHDFQRHLATVIAASYELGQIQRQAHGLNLIAELGRSAHAWFGRLPAWEQHSNHSAAIHAHVKLACLGYRLAEGTERGEVLPKVDKKKIKLLAKIEHNRWMAERLLSGWTCGERENAMKKRPALVPWESLREDERQKDREQVTRLLDLFSVLSADKQASEVWSFRLSPATD